MKKQSIANRKSLERIRERDPDKYEEKKRRNKFYAAKSFIKLYAKPLELVELNKLIKEKQKKSIKKAR
ncbi:hypothetical protein CBF53_07815 [Lactobacillus taiwanensis]|uniref:Uncharacterized protein n=1 Tax=Lactobacillus taiwanensis TaxID=508451 RepID=A0A256LC18_9LACO|nr:hypothetical protein [Lactobacillus taiwanensis]OYR87347.1 hypothetical protein CBF53_07815 [Lactobacillus taiwanensis]OYR90968.1 hypothetical protein CBF70_07260 [Lactobacillus taiwanensis]